MATLWNTLIHSVDNRRFTLWNTPTHIVDNQRITLWTTVWNNATTLWKRPNLTLWKFTLWNFHTVNIHTVKHHTVKPINNVKQKSHCETPITLLKRSNLILSTLWNTNNEISMDAPKITHSILIFAMAHESSISPPALWAKCPEHVEEYFNLK